MFHRALLIACFSLHYSSTSTSASTDLSPINYQCGQRQHHDRAKRIVGGNATTPGQFPWMVYLHMFEVLPHFCGASIIGRRWLLTAAHCVRDGPYRRVHHAFKGTHTRASLFWVPHILGSNIEDIFAHPNHQLYGLTEYSANYSLSDLFDTFTILNDIALIKLRQPLNFTAQVQPICLPTHDRQLAAGVPDTAFVAGWGGTRNQSAQAAAYKQRQEYPLFLQHVSVTLKRAERDPFARTLFGVEHCRQILLAKQDGGSGTCFGDSGGPLMRKSTGGGGYWFQHGIMSYSFRLKLESYPFNTCADPSSIAGYIRVSRYCDFIAQTTEGEVTCIDPDE